MKSLISYPAIVYDANCLLYYCMHSEIKDNSTTVTLTFPELTDKIRRITEHLVGFKKIIKTIEVIYEEIARTERAGKVVNDLIKRQEIREKLRLRRGEPYPPMLKFRFIKSLDKKIRGLKGKTWFNIIPFLGSSEDIMEIKDLYNNSPKAIALCKRKGRSTLCPSREDMHLLDFSAKNKLPILSNDTDLTDLKEELEKKTLCHKIVSLLEVVLEE